MRAIDMIPCTLVMISYAAFVVLGINAAASDYNVQTNECGKKYRFLKMTLINVLFASVTLVSYVTWYGGGEGTRARALLLITFHFALAMWGILMWLSLDETCSSVLSAHYPSIYLFGKINTGYNAMYFSILLLHEVYLGSDHLKCDMTIMPVQATTHQMDFSSSYSPPPSPPHSSPQGTKTSLSKMGSVPAKTSPITTPASSPKTTNQKITSTPSPGHSDPVWIGHKPKTTGESPPDSDLEHRGISSEDRALLSDTYSSPAGRAALDQELDQASLNV